MGISGHLLGEKQLRQLNKWSGHNFDKAYKDHQHGSARTITNGTCAHYDIDYTNKQVTPDLTSGRHWSTCPEITRHLTQQADIERNED